MFRKGVKKQPTTQSTKKNKDSQPTRTKNYNRLKGMRDILFDEYKYWELVIKKATELARVYGFKRIEIPVLENLKLYERTSGKSSDIVTKEMYSFVDKNGDKVALRPEPTAGLARTYIEHGMFNLPQPVKMFWLGSIFRHEKPQAGRYRQAHQFDLEILGEESPVADVLLILIANNFFSELQINVQTQINSIGCRECRKEYLEKLTEFYRERGRRAKLCNDCKKRLVKNPLRLLDCKEENCIAIKEEAPQIVDYLCDDCREHFIKVLEYLDELDINYNLNPYLVRGLDYYNRTVFEFWPLDEEGTSKGNLALGGGGRYDGLIEYMGGRPTPACGYGLGIERTVAKIKEKNIPLKKDEDDLIFLAQLGEQARRKSFVLFEDLRRSGYNVRQAFTKDSLKAQLEEANRVGAKISLILGQKEIIDGTILFRDMDSGIQEIVNQKKIKEEITKKLRNGDK